eukprot:gnl/Dysnectes_brevis/5087_a7166_514.p1 GENE.gnl/Dysnectes_brevis/5087_a7166_514~~gnl/Dysnectes_brevis/5087_a7166_514.p1  ORF type:complete len:211 (-),score=8.74 gnl/Dysnectes_brevis/5087_a7166_514:71-703(-)
MEQTDTVPEPSIEEIIPMNETLAPLLIFPSAFTEWSPRDVYVYLSMLSSHNYFQYADSFLKNAICGRALSVLTEDDLSILGMSIMGHRKSMMFEISRLQHWRGHLWHSTLPRPDSDLTKNVEEKADQKIELLFSLSPNGLTGFASIRTSWDAEIPSIDVTLHFRSAGEDIDSKRGVVLTTAHFTPKMRCSVIKLPCLITEVSAQFAVGSE